MLHPRPRALCLKPAAAGCFPAVACTSARAFVSGFLKAALRSVPLPLLCRLPFGVTYLGLDLLVDRTALSSYA